MSKLKSLKFVVISWEKLKKIKKKRIYVILRISCKVCIHRILLVSFLLMRNYTLNIWNIKSWIY